MSAPEAENDPVETAEMANVNETVEAASAAVAAAAPKSKLGLILGVFVLAAGGILGTQWYLQSQMPQADQSFKKEAAPEDDGNDPKSGGQLKGPAS